MSKFIPIFRFRLFKNVFLLIQFQFIRLWSKSTSHVYFPLSSISKCLKKNGLSSCVFLLCADGAGLAVMGDERWGRVFGLGAGTEHERSFHNVPRWGTYLQRVYEHKCICGLRSLKSNANYGLTFQRGVGLGCATYTCAYGPAVNTVRRSQSFSDCVFNGRDVKFVKWRFK